MPNNAADDVQNNTKPPWNPLEIIRTGPNSQAGYFTRQ